jgi:FkbM family methyltransferase
MILDKLFGKKKTNFTKKIEGYYIKEFDGIVIYSHETNCLLPYKHIFEREIYNFNSSTETPTILDVGANIGLGVLYWKKLYPKAKIIAFEPSKLAYKTLQKNVFENKLTDVTCINKAVSNTEATALFTTNELISGSLVTEKNLETTYEVETTKLGNFLKQQINFLKIDIEGAEKFIYNDVAENINNIDHLFLEYHSFIHERQYLSKYLTLFEENNFRYIVEDEYKRDRHFIDKKNSLNQDMQLNIWASKTTR